MKVTTGDESDSLDLYTFEIDASTKTGVHFTSVLRPAPRGDAIYIAPGAGLPPSTAN